MNATTLTSLKDAASSFWNEREPRERNMLLAAAAIILLALIYLLFINPALTGRAQLEKSLPQLRQQAAELQMLSRQPGVAGGAAAGPAEPLTKESLDASLARRGLKPQSTLVSGEIAKVQLQAASFAGIMGWLQDMQTTARMSVTESRIEAQAALDTVNATLTLRRQGAGARNE
jgi:general secretion pathway protein M